MVYRLKLQLGNMYEIGMYRMSLCYILFENKCQTIALIDVKAFS